MKPSIHSWILKLRQTLVLRFQLPAPFLRRPGRSRPKRIPLAALLALTANWLLAAPTNYAIWDLGTLGGNFSEARGINNASQIAGTARHANGSDHVFLWQGSTMSDLGPGGGFAISDAGHVILLDTQNGQWTRWQGGAKMVLTPLSNATALAAYSVNAGGVVVGYSSTRWQPIGLIVERAVRWSDGTPVVLGSDDGEYSRAWNLNNAGLVVGQQTTNDRTRVHAHVFGGAGDIHGLPSFTHSTARAINDAGQVVGFAYNFSVADATPFFWQPDGGMRLMRFAGYSFAQPLDLNNRGVAVGCAGPSSSAVMWLNAGQTNEQLINLQGTLPPGTGWDLDCAHSINDADEIVGYGKINGQTHAFLLYPTNPPYVPRHRLTGRVLVETRSMHTGVRETNALRDALIDLALVTNSPPDLLPYASAWTDAQGRFAFLLPTGLTHRVSLRVTLRDRQGRLEFYDEASDTNQPAWLRGPLLEVASDATAHLIMAINPNDADGSDNEVRFQLAGTDFVPETATADGAWPEGASNAGSGHFAHLAFLYVLFWDPADFARRRLNQAVPMVRVRGWHPASLGRQFSFHQDTCEVQAGAARSDFNNPDSPATPFSVRHEYGHAVQYASPISGVNHIPSLGRIQNHLGIGNTFSSDSWAEGFATWYACAVAQDLGHLFPQRQTFVGGELDLAYFAGIRLDDPRAPQFNMTFGNLGEELAIASVLWDVHQQTSLDALWAALRANVPDLETFQDVYGALSNDPAITNALSGLSCSYPQTGAISLGVDCLFVERGFYHDANGNGLYDPGERAGCTRWPALPPEYCRAETPPVTGSELRLHVVEAETGAAVSNVQFQLRRAYDPPLHTNDTTNVWFAAGTPPWDLPVTVPGAPSRLVITARKAGYPESAPLAIDSAFYHERVNPFREGGVSPLLLEHVFTLGLSRPVLQGVTLTNGLLQFSLATEPGRSYTIEFNNELTIPVWSLFTTLSGDGTVQSVAVPISASPARFFRVRVE